MNERPRRGGLHRRDTSRLVTAFTLGDQFSKRRSEVVGVVQAAISFSARR